MGVGDELRGGQFRQPDVAKGQSRARDRQLPDFAGSDEAHGFVDDEGAVVGEWPPDRDFFIGGEDGNRRRDGSLRRPIGIKQLAA